MVSAVQGLDCGPIDTAAAYSRSMSSITASMRSSRFP